MSIAKLSKRDGGVISPYGANGNSGVWSLGEVYSYIKQNTWPLLDPYWQYVSLLLSTRRVDGGQNNTFLDSSSNNFTITRNGNTTQGAFSPFSLAEGEWSNYFDGSGDYLTVADNAAFTVGSGNWTLEAWVYPTASPNQPIIFGQWSGSTDGSIAMMLSNDANRYLRGLVYSGGFVDRVSNSSLQLNAWNHCAFVREGTYLNLYLNGVRVDNYNWGSSSIQDSSLVVSIGASSSGSQPFQGNISNARFVKGTAIYSGATYTVPTAPLTAITNTSLLTCQSNRFVDNSSNAFAITRNGDVRVTPFSPFAPSAAYSASVNGGSGYFDGTGDYLTVADNAAFDLSGDFTIEFVAYATGANNRRFLQLGDYRSANNGLVIYTNASNALVVYVNGATIITGSAFPLNQWVYVALVRSGGGSNNLKLYANAVQDGQATSTVSFTGVAGNGVSIGAEYGGSYSATAECYISNVRIVNGTALTPAIPTTPLTAVANTQLLLNFTNANIFDSTGKNNLETVGNAQISTAQSKFGGASAAFDGTGDYLSIANSTDFDIDGDWSLELWYYQNIAAGTNMIVGRGGGAAAWNSTDGFYWAAFTESGSLYFQYYSGVTGLPSSISTSSPATGAWHHLAVTRSSGEFAMFVDGVSVGTPISQAIVKPTSTAITTIGVRPISSPTGDFNGYIDDLRITKGIARYTGNFTPPQREFRP